ncbi:MAG: Nif3-like dinuclear metal center hexameric protein [Helicobacteraceae bacterium 4484_230]|nr:MAG: Nif3-like dinuclear metal center hexameric protein [Helicobacteraceae bacterium 4484_230]
MRLSDIYDRLDGLSSFELQEPWDNSGIIVGDPEREIEKIVLSIDIDEALLEEIEEGTLIITHHPLIFDGLKQLRFDRYPAKLLETMVKKEISNIAMHTNFDQTHLNAYVAEEVLGCKIAARDGFVVYLDIRDSFDVFARKVADRLRLEQLKTVKCSEAVTRVALTTGSGASLIDAIEADCFLTGDIKYHDAMKAKTLGLSLIDIGHFESERYFGEVLGGYLKNLGLTVIISSSKNPFTYI